MLTIFRWVIATFLTVIIVIFAVLNRGTFDIFWSPLQGDAPMVLPVYLVVLGAMALGFMIGALAVWLNYAPLRAEKRRQKREIKGLQKEVGALKEAQFSPPAQELFPALPAQSRS